MYIRFSVAAIEIVKWNRSILKRLLKSVNSRQN